MPIYSGIGPREIPTVVSTTLREIAKQLSPTGWIMRSGTQKKGADGSFEKGASQQQLFLPWEGFQGRRSNGINCGMLPPCLLSYRLAMWSYEADPHGSKKPQWKDLKKTTKLLMIRNVPVILGEYLNRPSDCVITWFPPDYDGGTMHAVRIARAFNVPVFNVHNYEDQVALCKFTWEIEQ